MRILAIGDPLWGDAAHLGLYESAHGHEVRTAGPAGSVDYIFSPHETAAEFIARISVEWTPDVVYCSFPEMYPPPLKIEECPIRTVAAISDWNLYGPQLEYNLSRFDAVLSDVDATNRLKLHGARPRHLFPLYSHRTHIHRRVDRPRDIDVLFLGNLNHAIHRERGRVLEHVARRSEGLRVVIDAGLPPDDYAMRLNEAKIALNFGVRGEMNLRSFEAPACGALLFVEEDNLEVFDWLEPWEQCIPYSMENVERLIRQYVADEEARERIAAAGQRRILTLAAEQRLDMLFGWMGRAEPGPRPFALLDGKRKTLSDALLYGSSMHAEQREYSREILQRLRDQHPHDGEVLLACGCSAFDHATSLGNALHYRETRRALVREAINAFDAAHRHLPGEVVPLMNLAILARQAGAAAAEEKYLEHALDLAGANFGGYLLGKVTDPFYAEWRLALALGTADVAMLDAAIHTRLAELCLAEKDPASALRHATEAIANAPHVGLAYALAGRAARALGDIEAAAKHLEAGLPHTSFDAGHRQALIEVYRALGRDDDANQIAAESVRIFSTCPPLAAFVGLFESAG